MNILFDTHCHLCLDEFQEDLDSVVQRAFDRGVQYILVPGLDLRTSVRAISISEKYPTIFAAIGFHPQTQGKWDLRIAKEFEELSVHPKVVAIGEIGLDQFQSEVSCDEQEIRFQAQLQIALQVHKPVLLHNRGETKSLLKLLSEAVSNSASSLQGVFHAYGGDPDIFSFAEKYNFYLGIGGIITFPKSTQLRQLAPKVLARVILETDSPELAPKPYRGKRNEPGYLPIICKYLSEITEQTDEKLSGLTTKNAMSLLRIK